jgi:hypothetical protein
MTTRNGPAIEWKVKTCSAQSPSRASLVSMRSRPAARPAAAATTRNSSDVPTYSLPIVRGSPDPTTAASPAGRADGSDGFPADGAATAATASGEASVTVIDAPWAGDGFGSGI